MSILLKTPASLLQNFAVSGFQGSHTSQPLTVSSPQVLESTRPRGHDHPAPGPCSGYPCSTSSQLKSSSPSPSPSPSSQGSNALLECFLPGLCGHQGASVCRGFDQDVPTGVHEVQAEQEGARGGERIRIGWKSTFLFSQFLPTLPDCQIYLSKQEDRTYFMSEFIALVYNF